MICGLGTDIIEIRRIKEVIVRHGNHFLETIFTQGEIASAPPGETSFAYYAARWAVKEATAKALGTGIGHECRWLDIEIVRQPSGAPTLELSGKALETARKKGGQKFHVSLSHEKEYANAIVIIEGF